MKHIEAIWDRLDAAFAAALDLPSGSRQPWLEETLSDDPETLQAIKALLEVEAESAERFDRLEDIRDRLLAELSGTSKEASEGLQVGAVYGAWKVAGRLGEGGSSVVYEVERADGRYEQRCALKVIRSDRAGRSTDGFLRERRILSALDHPGIVRILDAGETETGAPWLVMDLVRGRNIADHCRHAGLSLNGRLQLVMEVAEALQSAHSRLIIHRDIKPDNIVVSKDGRPRLLDFGVASLINGEDERSAPAAMTPNYASPEQRCFQEVTTASDIYQLGRVLNEVCEPFHPLRPQVQAVIDKATHQEPGARYQTAAGLAEDLRRVIAGDPPLARPETSMEMVTRLIRRHKALTGLAAVIVLSAGAWVVALNIHARQLDAQRSLAVAAADRAERGRTVLLDLFRRMDPIQTDGSASLPGGIEDIVGPVLANVREQLADDSPLQAELLAWAASLSERAGDEDQARIYLTEAIDLLDQAGSADTSIHADLIAYRGTLSIGAGDYAGGEADIFKALAVARRAPADDRFALSVIVRAALSRNGQWAEQALLFEEALSRLGAGAANSEIEIRSGLGRAYLELGRLDEGERQVDMALVRAEAVYGSDHPRLALPLSVKGQYLRRQGDIDAAIEAGRRAYELSRAAFGATYKSTLSHQNNLALAQADAGQLDEAATLLLGLAETYARLDGDSSLRAGEAFQNLATIQMRAGRHEDALNSLERAATSLNGSLPGDAPRRYFPALTSSEALLALGRFDQAEVQAEAAFDGLSASLPAGHFAIEIARCRVGIALIGQGLRDEGEPLVLRALEGLSNSAAVPQRHYASCAEAVPEGRLHTLP